MRQAWIRQTPRSQRPDAAETGGTDHRVNWEGVTDTPPGDMKKQNTKLGPRHCPLHQWKFARKEKRGGEKERSVRRAQSSQRRACCASLAHSGRERAPTLRALGTTAAPRDACSGPQEYDAASLDSHITHPPQPCAHCDPGQGRVFNRAGWGQRRPRGWSGTKPS